MKLIIHDLDDVEFRKLFPNVSSEMKIISEESTIHNCIGCFGCWIKTPGKCVIQDSYADMGELVSKCDEVILLSSCCYGGFSPFVKNILDRGISYVHPYFQIIDGEMHHKRRYKNQLRFNAIFYGSDISHEEQEIARRLVERNAINLHCSTFQVSFLKSLNSLKSLLGGEKETYEDGIN